MTKVKQIEPNYKISVDYYEENDNGTVTAYCFTPGLVGEKSYLERTVTMQSLEETACDTYGKVRVTYLNDTQETEDLTFAMWYANNRHSEEVHDLIADIINKSEGRKESVPFGGVPNANVGLMDRTVHYLQTIAKPAKTA